MSGKLPTRDHIAAGQLKYLRNRSLRNVNWRRDPAFLARFLTRDDLRWSSPSVLDPELLVARSALAAYAAETRKYDKADEAWLAVLTAVDALLKRADEVNALKIPGRSI